MERSFFVFDEVCRKLCRSLFLFSIHVEMVCLGIPNFSDVTLLVILFSISRLILHFCISDTLFRFCLTADILRLNQILFCNPRTFFSFLFTLNPTVEFQRSIVSVFVVQKDPRRKKIDIVREKPIRD